MMLLFSLIIHLLSDLSKDALGVEYEGDKRSGTSALGSESGGGGVCELHKDINEWEREQSAKGTRVGCRTATLGGNSAIPCMDSLLDALTSVPPGE